MYEPEEHAAALGLDVIDLDPQQGRLGLYIPRLRAIIIKPDLHPHDRRTVLAHEIRHHETGTRHTYTGREEQLRVEHDCDRVAAQRLIPFPALADEVAGSADPGLWAMSLRVNGRMIRARLRSLTPGERELLDTIHLDP